MSLTGFLKAVAGVLTGTVSFTIAGIGHLISYGSYSSIKKTGISKPFVASFKDWVLPYKPEKYWQERGKNYLKEAESGIRELPDSSRKLLFDALIDSLNKVSFSSLVEIGCGFGRNLKLVSDSFSNKTLLGTDFSQEMLSSAKSYLKLYPKIRLQRQDARSLRLKDNSFDLVLSCETLMYIPKKDIKKAVSEIIRVSKKYVLLIEPDLPRIPFFQRLFHANQISFHNYPNLFTGLKTELFYSTSIPYQFRTVYIFKKRQK